MGTEEYCQEKPCSVTGYVHRAQAHQAGLSLLSALPEKEQTREGDEATAIKSGRTACSVSQSQTKNVRCA